MGAPQWGECNRDGYQWVGNNRLFPNNDDSRNDDSSSEMMKTVRLNLALYKTTAETLTVEMMTLRKNS